MQIHITDQMAKWFEDELALHPGDHVRFYVRYGGSSPIQQGFSLGINKEEPIELGVELVKNEICYFVETRDTWYFDQYDLYVDYDSKQDEPIYDYK